MKAVAIFPKDKNIQVIDAPAPASITPNQLRVKTLEIGLCGTDTEIVEQGYGNTPEDSDYLILGHECLGEIVEVGSDVSHFKVGQLVVPRVRRPCSVETCRACQVGRPDFCLSGQFTERGIVKHHGFMIEEFVDDQQYFHALTPELRHIGVLVEPLTIAEKALLQIRDVQDRLPYLDAKALKEGSLEGSTAVVLGAGPVGLLGAMAFCNAGARVFVYSRSAEPNEKSVLIEGIGAEYVSSQTVSVGQFLELAGNVDIIYEATGASAFAFEMTQLLGRNGIYIFTGVPGRKAPVPINTAKIMNDMVLKNQLLVGTVNAGPAAFESAVHTLGEINRRWPSNVKDLITKHISPDQVGETLKSHSEGIKTVVCFS